MNKICTSIEQSKKLIELKLPKDSADMFYLRADIALGEIECYPNALHREDIGDDIPAWSLSALLELIQCDYKLEKTLFDQSDYFTYSIVCDDLDYRTFEYDNPIDAAFEMLVWLKEKIWLT